jgi:hypothetical protein
MTSATAKRFSSTDNKRMNDEIELIDVSGNKSAGGEWATSIT